MGAETGARSEVIDAPVSRIVAVLLDYEAFPQWQGIVLSCDVLERDEAGRGAVVHMTVDARVRKIEYAARYTYDLPHSLSWRQISGDLKDNRGRYAFTPRPDGSTDVSIDIAFQVGFYIPGPIKNLIRDQSLKVAMRELRERVESTSR